MENLTILSNEAVESFIKSTGEQTDRISGSGSGRWIMLKDITLGSAFNVPKADLVIQFPEDNPVPVILLSEAVEIKQVRGICGFFLNSEPYIPGWKRACCEMFADVGEDIFEFVILVGGLLSQPDLCGAMGCSQKACVVELNEPVAS